MDYVVYNVRHGPGREAAWLKLMFGLLVGGNSPHGLEDRSITWTATAWNCGDLGGVEWRGVSADGRRWRHIRIPLAGFAAYAGAPPKAALYFDRILDTMCCGKGPQALRNLG